MLASWAKDPKDRPTFENIVEDIPKVGDSCFFSISQILGGGGGVGGAGQCVQQLECTMHVSSNLGFCWKYFVGWGRKATESAPQTTTNQHTYFFGINLETVTLLLSCFDQ